MKQLLFTIILFLSGINILQAQETNSIEETTWNVIRERLFSGENSNVIRFEDDIEFKLSGLVTAEDSVILQEIIVELNELIENVDVRFAENYGNFQVSLISPDRSTDKSPFMKFSHEKIETVKLEIIAEKLTNLEERRRYFYYYIFGNLTRKFNRLPVMTDYNGIFNANTFPQFNKLSELDKDVIRKIYSNNFYSDLKANTIKNYGTLFYLNLRYGNWVKKISFSIGIVLIIIGFLILLASSKNNQQLSFWHYYKKAFIIILWLALSQLFITVANAIPFRIFSPLWLHFLINFSVPVVSFILVPALLYGFDNYFLNRFDKFFQRQIFVFITTLFSIMVGYIAISAPFAYINSKNSFIKFPNAYILNLSMIHLFIIIAFLRILFNFINYRMQSMVNQKDVELAKMKELKNQAELNALHSRINPHFLYNSLNSIAELAHINPDKTENMATALSELFRYSINKENKTFVTIKEELEMVKKYLEIEKTRFEDKLNYTIIVDETVKEKLIPKFLIQPLAENAIKHGLSKIKEPGRITIEVKQLENDLVITIFDNGPDFPEEPVSGYGLQNLNDKLEIIYGKDSNINWENGDNKHIRITIKNQFKG
jgi:two-component system, LytTR family, sensor kinase